MTQENKELLLKDLCSRLPYRVKCQVREDEFTYIGTLCRLEVDNKNRNLLDFSESMSGLDCQVYLSEVKPYLFPLSSLTEEQLNRYGLTNVELIEEYENEFYLRLHHFGFEDYERLLDFFYENHLDYRGLIEKGLAIDATGLNIY